MKYLILIFAVFTGLSASAQVVHGQVIDEQGPVPGAVVQMNDTVITTSETGAFRFDPGPGTYELRVNLPGYLEYFETFVLAGDEVLERMIRLIPDRTVLSDVIVSAGRFEQRPAETTVSVDVLKPRLISDRAQTDISETFQQASGVNITDKQVNIRAGSGWSYGAGTRVLVLLDDMPLISPDAGQAQWSQIPVEAVNRMEIIKGAASALYGTSAVNGIINVRTLDPSAKPQTDIRLYQGFYDLSQRPHLKWWNGPRGQTGTQFSHTRAGGSRDQLGWVIAGNVEQNSGYTFGVPESRSRLFGKFRYSDPERPAWKFALSASGMWSETGDALLWNGLDQAYIPLDSQATNTTGGDFYIDPNISYRSGRFLHTLRGRWMAVNNNARSETTNYANFSRWSYGEYLFQYFGERLTTTLGLAGSLGRSNSEIFGGLHNSTNPAVFAQADYNLQWLRLSGGVRYEQMTIDEQNWSQPVFRFGANGGTRRTRFRASIGQGFRFPSMAEIYTRTNVGALNVFPNPNLRPESGWSAEAGVRQELKLGSWSGYLDAAAFLMHYDDMMEFTFGRWANTPGGGLQDFGFKSVNVGATRVRGVEFALAGDGRVGEVSVQFMGGLTWMDPRPLYPDSVYATTRNGVELSYTSTSSNPESGILKYRYRRLFKWDMQATWKRWSLGTSIRHNDFMANIDAIFVDPLIAQLIPDVAESREAQPNGDWIMDARLRYRVSESVSLAVVANNFTDRVYMPRPAMMGAPRSFVFQIRYKP